MRRWPLAALALLIVAPLAHAQAPAGSGSVALPSGSGWSARHDPAAGWVVSVTMPAGSNTPAPSIDLPPGAGWSAAMAPDGTWGLTFAPPPGAAAAAPRAGPMGGRPPNPGAAFASRRRAR